MQDLAVVSSDDGRAVRLECYAGQQRLWENSAVQQFHLQARKS
jgi:hypothetical protein